MTSNVPISVLHRAIRQWVLNLVGMAAIMFLPAGDFGWAKGWVFLVVFAIQVTIATVYLWRTNPDIFVARSKFQEGTKRWDKILVTILMIVAMTIFPVAALDDGRFHWSNVPLAAVAIGYVVLTFGSVLMTWIQRVNKFAEPGVRIHPEDQKVIDTGPYAFVRHPMYAGVLPFFFGIALALGSYWAMIPAALASLMLVYRLTLEDRALHDELPGYRDYANRVRSRLIPGVW